MFGVLRLINFAYGQLIMLAAYALAFTDSWPDAASVLAAVLVAVVASLLMERIAFRPLRTADPSTMLVATFALAYLLENAALVQYTYRQQGIVGDSDRHADAAQPGGHDRVAAHPLGVVPRHRRRGRLARPCWRCC